MKYLTLTKDNDLQSVIDSLSNEPCTIYLEDGIYKTNLVINKDNLTIIGESRNNTIITSNKHANQVNRDLFPNITFRTDTVQIVSSNVVIENLTIENSAGVGPGVGQAIALSLYGNNIKVSNCNILGSQDTLFLGPLPLDLIDRYQNLGIINFDYKHFSSPNHFINNSKIIGTTDFIFGSSKLIIYNSEIISYKDSYIFAPSTYESSSLGIVVVNSKIINKANSPTMIARPWRNHGYLALLNNEFIGQFHNLRFGDWNKTTYHFFETPYVKSNYSAEIPKEHLILIKHLLNNWLNS